LRTALLAFAAAQPRWLGEEREVLVRMATGTVKWFSDDKGFGFVTPDEAGKDLFVHYSDIDGEGFRSLAEGSRVEYEAQAGDKGPKAVNVRLI
jgi:CspA family cold shock protein